MVWGIIAVFLFLMGIVTLGASAQIEDPSATDVIFFFTNVGGQIFVPIIALVVGYMAIVGERQSGSLRILFGLSHNRRDVLFGKLVSRTGVIAVATLVACAFAVALMIGLFGSLPVRTVLGFVTLTLLLGAAFTAIAVGVSAMTDTRMRAMGGAIGSYILFTLVWHPLVAGVHYLLAGELVGLEAPAWYLFALRLNPLEAYRAGYEPADRRIRAGACRVGEHRRRRSGVGVSGTGAAHGVEPHRRGCPVLLDRVVRRRHPARLDHRPDCDRLSALRASRSEPSSPLSSLVTHATTVRFARRSLLNR